MIRVAAAALAVVVLFGCKSSAGDDEPPKVPDPISEAEAARGKAACDAYVERLCRCAEAKPELAEDCQLQKGKRSALDMILRANRGNATPRERFATQEKALKIMSSCFQDNNELDAYCPR